MHDKMSFQSCSASLLILITLLAAHGLAEDRWVRFRGPNGSGMSDSMELPTQIEESNIKWKFDLNGSGSSSPVVINGKVFVTSFQSSSNHPSAIHLHCIDLEDGKQIRETKFQLDPIRVHKRNSPASSTPTVSEHGVYLAICDREGARLLALDFDGKLRWKRDLGTFPSQHGFGASPIVEGDNVILFLSQQGERMRRGQQPGSSRMIAFAQSTGETVWETKLKTTRACYAVPAVIESENGNRQIVSCNTGNGFFGIDAVSGKLNWSVSPFKMRTVASLLWTGNRMIGSCGSGGGGNYLVALEPNQGKDTEPFKVAYRIDKANYVPSPIEVDDKLFLFTDKGVGRCFNVANGELIWEKRIASGFSGSPIAANHHVYVMDESGNLLVVQANGQPNVVSKFSLGDSSRSTPAAVSDRLLVRTEGSLFCIAK